MINRFDISNKETVDYHRNQAHSIYVQAYTPARQRNQIRSMVNRSFFAGRQWIFEDDIELFLKDESDNIRNRVRFSHNMMKPVVRQFVGNAIRTSFDYSVMAVSQQAQTRMENKLNELMGITEMQKALPNFAEAIRNKYPVGKTKEETRRNFAISYKDEYAIGLNYLIASIQDSNKFEMLKIQTAENLALDGIGILYEEEYNGEQVFSSIKSKDFIFDMSAILPDLSDAMYKGHMCLMSTPALAEAYNVDRERMIVIENRVRNNNLQSMTQRQQYDGYVGLYTFGEQVNKVPVVKLYWDDISRKRYACFLDPYGYECIHEVESDKDSYYHESKIIQPTQKSLVDFFKGKLVINYMTSETRYCHFIPASFMSSESRDFKSKDVEVLKYGILKYSNSDSIYKTKPYFPYQTYCWKYNEGEIFSPVDDIVDPQRYYNRIMSVSENQVNNSSLSGAAIDKNAVDAKDGEESIIRDMASGKPIFLDAPDGIHNALGRYQSNVGDGAFNLHNIAKDVKSNTMESAGVNENMQGTGGGYRVSANVVASNIQQGTLMQEDFYFALNSIMYDSACSIIKRGRMIYLENDRKLSVRVGDNFARVFELSKEMATEDFRISVKRTTNVSDLIQAGQERALFYLQNQLIDTKTFAQIFGNSTPSEVDYAFRKYQAELNQAQIERKEINDSANADKARAAVLSAQAAETQGQIQTQSDIEIKNKKATADMIRALSDAAKSGAAQQEPA